MKVDRIYTRNIVGIPRSGTLQEAAETMRRFHVGTLIVIDGIGHDAAVVGILTDRDLVLQAIADNLDVARVPVHRIMSPMVAGIGEDADVLEALERMRAAGVRRLLVTGARGEPAGILALDDIVDGLASELARAAALVRTGTAREVAEGGGLVLA